MIQAEEYITRRARLMASLPADSIVVVPSADIHTQGNGTDFPFVQDTSFLYLTGFNEPNAWLLLSNRQTAEQEKAVSVSLGVSWLGRGGPRRGLGVRLPLLLGFLSSWCPGCCPACV